MIDPGTQVAALVVKKLIDSYTEIEQSRLSEETKREEMRIKLQAFNELVSKNYKLYAIWLSHEHEIKLKIIDIYKDSIAKAIEHKDMTDATKLIEQLGKFITPVPDFRLDGIPKNKMFSHHFEEIDS